MQWNELFVSISHGSLTWMNEGVREIRFSYLITVLIIHGSISAHQCMKAPYLHLWAVTSGAYKRSFAKPMKVVDQQPICLYVQIKTLMSVCFYTHACIDVFVCLILHIYERILLCFKDLLFHPYKSLKLANFSGVSALRFSIRG